MSPQAKLHEDMLRERRDNPTEPPEGMDLMEAVRLANDEFGSWATDPGVTTAEADADGVRALWIDHEGADGQRVVLYLHGGAYILGSADHVANLVGHIGRAAGCRVLSVDYRLAPENAFPAAVDDALTAYGWLLDQGVRPGDVVVAGDSAGGGLALALVLAIPQRGLPQPAGVVAISPWGDLGCTADSWARNSATDVTLTLDDIVDAGAMYAGAADLADPLVSPVNGDYTNVPPIYIQLSGHETLLDDGFAVAAQAASDGVDVRLDVFPQMQHVFQYCAGNMPEADDAVARIGNWVRLQTAG